MSNYTILIVCEGENTEPLFFNSIRDQLIETKKTDNPSNIKLTIAPEPKVEEKIIDKIVKHKEKRKVRKTKSIPEIDKIEIIKGKPPLRWVQTAIRELKTGAFHEVWTVFDNDNHPAKEEAFKAAKELVNGKTIQIAYSSRSFEQYILTHFERKYTPFVKTDCKYKIKKRSYLNRCGTNVFPDKDCNGNVCINGYASTKGFWKNTNEDNSKQNEMFSLINDKLEIGFENSSWIRYQSDLHENETPLYNKNPYTDADLLIKKLLGYYKIHQWLKLDKMYTIKNISIYIDSKTKILTIKNISDTIVIIPNNILIVYKGQTDLKIGDKTILDPENRMSIRIDKYQDSETWFKICHEEYILMFENKA